MVRGAPDGGHVTAAYRRSRKTDAAQGGYRGNWLNPTTRLAIYLRGGLGCAWCLRDWSELAQGLTVEHVVPRSAGGADASDNLVVACRPCNAGWRAACDAAAAEAARTGHPADPWRRMAARLGLADHRALKRQVLAQCGVSVEVFRPRARALLRRRPAWLADLLQRARLAGSPASVNTDTAESPQAPVALSDPVGVGDDMADIPF